MIFLSNKDKHKSVCLLNLLHMHMHVFMWLKFICFINFNPSQLLSCLHILMRTEFSHAQEKYVSFKYFPSAVKQSKEVFNTIFFILVLFWMLSLFYFEKGKIFFLNIRVKVIFPLKQRARYVLFLLDNSLQLLVVVVVVFSNKSHTCLLRNPGPFFFGESLKLPEIWWSPGMDLDVFGGCPVLLVTTVFFQNLHKYFLHDFFQLDESPR